MALENQLVAKIQNGFSLKNFEKVTYYLNFVFLIVLQNSQIPY